MNFDRPAAVLLGAVACVALGVLTPAQALHAVDPATLLLLFGVMGMGAFLTLDGFFEEAEGLLLEHFQTPQGLLAAIVWGAGGLAALVTNDAVCVLGAPLVVRLIQRHQLPPLPFLLALATGANTGSVATLVGNPQNMLCATLGGLSYRSHLLMVGPVALAGLALNHAWLAWVFRSALGEATLQPSTSPGSFSRAARLDLTVIAGTAVIYTLGADLAWTSVGGFVVMMLLHRRDTRDLWQHIDWSLLLFFSGLFVTVEGLMQSQAPALFFQHFPLFPGTALDIGGWFRVSGIFLAGSNLVSNVPFILVIRDQLASAPNPTLAWELLAVASTFAGNLTLIGSVANIIVAESARDLGGIGFLEYLRVGFPLAVVTTLLGTLWLVLIG